MAYRLDATRPGIMIYHLSKVLTKPEISGLVKEVERALAEGKTKFILSFTKEAAVGVTGYGYVRNAFGKAQLNAQKMRGDILYVLPQLISARLEGTFHDLNLALQMVAAGRATEDHSKIIDDLKKQIMEQNAQITKLTTTLDLLTKKNQELVQLVGKPITAAEWQAAVEHYRNLASESQSVPPIVRSSCSKDGPR